jgi:probable F420-dependent oxidoreductase
VHVGISMFLTEYSISPAALAQAVEDRGFESLFVPEHTHIPASRETPYPLGPELPKEYIHLFDPFVALAVMAGVTRRLRLGTNICLVVEHDPIALAKQMVTLDVVSNGRFLFGVGGGWNLEEMRNHGTDPAHRFKLLRERVLAMKALWTEEEASFHGQYVNFDRIWLRPRPVQQPHPPILIGSTSASPATLKRVAAYGDEWIPLAGIGLDVGLDAGLPESITTLNALAARRGRGPIPVSVPALPDRAALARYQALGVRRCVFSLPTVGEAEAVQQLDQLAPFVAEFGERVVPRRSVLSTTECEASDQGLHSARSYVIRSAGSTEPL